MLPEDYGFLVAMWVKSMKKLIFFSFMLLSISGFGQQYRYYKMQMHCHSTNSDGVMSPDSVAKQYLSRGYRILCLTDHNYVTPDSAYAIPGLLTISSEEYTFAKHMNGFFLKHTVDATGFTPQQAIDSVRAQGGMIQFNHPVVAPNTSFPFINDWSYTFPQFMALQNGPDFIEVHNAGTDLLQATFKMPIWDSLLMNNRKFWGTATDDMHHLTEVGLQSIDIGWVQILLDSLCQDSVRAALVRGDFYGSNGVEISQYSVKGDTIHIASANAATIDFIGDWGQLLCEVAGNEATFVRTNQKYIRIELKDNGILGVGKKYAFTQPVFFKDMGNASVDEVDNGFHHNVSAFPNPCSSILNVCFSTEGKSNVIIEISDITGKQLMSENNSFQQKGNYKIPVDVSQLTRGIYLYSVETNGTKITKKFIKT